MSNKEKTKRRAENQARQKAANKARQAEENRPATEEENRVAKARRQAENAVSYAGNRSRQSVGSILGLMVGSMVFMECVFRIGVGDMTEAAYFMPLEFACLIGAFWSLLVLLINNRIARKVIGIGATLINVIMYGSQLVYKHIFQTYYTVYSMMHGGQVAEFWRDILIGMKETAIPLFFIIVIGVIVIVSFARNEIATQVVAKGSSEKSIGKAERENEKIRDERMKFIRASLFIFLATLVLIVAETVVQSENTAGGPYGAMFCNNSIELSVRELGVPAAMCLDAGRNIFGFEGKMLDESAATEEVVVTNYPDNVTVDFTTLAMNETDDTYREMDRYFGSVAPTAQNEYTGLFAGKNLIFITGESYSSLAIDKVHTPTLYKLQHEGFNFTNFYNPLWGVSTSDGEYVATQGLIPKAGVWSMKESSHNYLPYTMGNQFKKLGYRTLAYHNHYAEYYYRTDSHPNMGYEYHGLGTGLKVTEMWPESDLQMMELTCPVYLTPDENGQIAPFHIYYMTVSGHLNYNFGGQAMCKKHKDEVQDINMSEACKAYIACNMELDQALEHMLNELEAAGQLDNTVIVMSGDHYPYGLKNEEISEFLGHPVDPTFELYHSSLVIYNSATEPQTIDKICSSLDIIPTISNLFGLEYDSRLLMGKDIFSDSAPLVMFKDQSWITNKAAYNATTGQLFAPDGVSPANTELSDAYVQATKNIVSNKFNMSRLILEKDYYRHILQ